jgi:putative ABC transport system ATP-binding protein
MLHLNRNHGLTFVWVTHAPDVARHAQRLITMRDGQIVDDHPLAGTQVSETQRAAPQGLVE